MLINNSTVHTQRPESWNAVTGADASESAVTADGTRILESSSLLRKDDVKKDGLATDILPAAGPTSSKAVASACEKLNALDLKSIDSDIADIMAMVAKIQIEMRKLTRQLQLEEQDAALKVGADAVKKMREQANTKMIGAVVAGVMQAVGGIIQTAGGAKQFKSINDGHCEVKASAAGMAGSAGSTLLGGLGTIVNAIQERQAAGEGADQEALQLQVKAHDAKSQQALSLAQEMLDALRDLLQKLTSINQAKADTDRNIVHI